MTRMTDSGRSSGFTLVELLVGMAVFSALSGLLLTAVLSTGRATDTNTVQNDLNEEARNVLNRVTRELREAKRITSVTNPNGPGYNPDGDAGLTIEVDFDGDGTIEPTAADPEVLTYTYQRLQRRLVLTAGSSLVPVLAGDVETFRLTYASRIADVERQALDGLSSATPPACGSLPASPVRDSELTWPELDADPTLQYGDCSGTLTAQELQYINVVGIDISVLKAPRQQHYRTRVDLRNNRS